MSEEKVVAGQYLHTEIPLQSLSVTDKKLNVKASDLETLLGTLNSKVATQTTLAAILNKIIAAPSTAEKQDLIKGVLDTIAGKDYATQTTLGELKQKIDDLYNKVASLIDENNTAKVTVSGTFPSLRRYSTEPKPTTMSDGSPLPKYSTLWTMDTDVFESWNGEEWVVIN